MKPARTKTPRDASETAFRLAAKMAATSRVARLQDAALDLGNDEHHANMDALLHAFATMQRRAGATGWFTLDDAPEGVDPQVIDLVSHYADAGYLYGLAVGLQLGRGGAR